MPPLPELLLPDQEAWKVWLRRNHLVSQGVRLVLARKGVVEPTSLTHPQALEEALCCGWIDSTAGRGSSGTFTVRFTPRRRGSIWSERNTKIVERLIAEGRMQSAGQAEVDNAKADGRWAAAYRFASAEMPADLIAALERAPEAEATCQSLNKQNRFAIVFRLNQAKRPETRARRLEAFIQMLARGETPYPQVRRPGS